MKYMPCTLPNKSNFSEPLTSKAYYGSSTRETQHFNVFVFFLRECTRHEHNVYRVRLSKCITSIITVLEKIINHTKTTIGGISEDISSTNGVSQSYPFDITFDVRELDDDITTPAMSIQLGDKLLKSGNTYILTTTITGAGTVTMHLVVNGVQPEDFIYPPTNWPGIISLGELHLLCSDV